jgi:hypothetical protein
MNTRLVIGSSVVVLLIGGTVGGYFAFGGSSKKETNVPIELRDPILETAKTRGVIEGYRLVDIRAAQNISYITSDQNLTLRYTDGCPGGPESLGPKALCILYRTNARSLEEVRGISRIAIARGMRIIALPLEGYLEMSPNERQRVERALLPYVAGAEKDAGEIRAVNCSPSGRYHGRAVYFCKVRRRDVITVWCASLANGKLLTQDQGIPCPSPGGPNRNPFG